MTMLHRIDDFLLDRVYQPLIDRWQTDCVAIGRDTMLSCIVMTVVQIPVRAYLIPDLAMSIVTLLALLIMIANVAFLRYMVRPMLGRNGLNPLRILWFMPRMFFFCLFTIGDIHIIRMTNMANSWDVFDTILEVIRDVSLVSGLYFASCSNRPALRQRSMVWQPG